MRQVELRYVCFCSHTRSGRLVDVQHLAFLCRDDHCSILKRPDGQRCDTGRSLPSVLVDECGVICVRYSNFDMRAVFPPMPTVMPAFTLLCSLKLRSMLKGSDIAMHPPCCLMCRTPVTAAKMAWTMRLTFALTLASMRALSRNNQLRVERGAIVDEGYNRLSAFTKHHADEPP